jgi:hypothetical protein
MAPKLSFPKREHDAPPRSFSEVLRALGQLQADSVTVATVQAALADRSFAALIMFFALINMMPLPLGSSLILGIPILLLSVQMALGRPTPWLPQFILNRSLSRETFVRLQTKLSPWIERFEKYVRPRKWPFDRIIGERLLGFLIAFLSILLIIPIPFGNWPPAFAIFFVALALSERDGHVLGFAVFVSVVAIALFGFSSAVIFFVSKGALEHLPLAG